MQKVRTNDQRINEEQMMSAIIDSGYLIEQRVETSLRNAGYWVQTNSVYEDNDTKKTREIDISASKDCCSTDSLYAGIELIIECENNHQPVVVFSNESTKIINRFSEFKYSGIPLLFSNINYEGVDDLIRCKEFHHYYKMNPGTQYCSFQYTAKESKWIALHNDEQHNSFVSLIKSLEYKMDKDLNPFNINEDSANRGQVDLMFYYPVIVLQNKLYEAKMKDGETKLTPKEHLTFRKQLILDGEEQDYVIDIITEKYISNYLQLIENELKTISKRIIEIKDQLHFESKKEQQMTLHQRMII